MVQRTDPQEKRDRLEAWVSTKLPSAQDISMSELEKVAGGYASEIHFFDLSWREGADQKMERLVIREEPMVFRVFPEYQLDREFNTIRCLQDSDIPVPKVYWLETDDAVIGAPFFIMERVDGRILDPQQFGDEPGGPLHEATPEERREMFHHAVETMAKINSIDCTRIGHSYAGAPQNGREALDQSIDFYRSMADWAAVEPRPLIDGAFDWFDKNRFNPGHLSLCWGDARLGNLMYRDGRIAAVLDWDMTYIGVPETDLAWYLAVDWLTGDSGLRGARWEGIPAREETIQAYEGALGRKLDDFFYHEAFAFLKLGIIFWRVVTNIPGIPPEFVPENPFLVKAATMLGLEDLVQS